LLSASKGVAGVASNSPALISDAAHSFSDIATDLVTLLSHKKAREPADWDHPFGHGKFESLGTVCVGASHTLHHSHPRPHSLTPFTNRWGFGSDWIWR
jgi:divalent metal cation (Fe/Co/Zn/Cd) transporter